MDPQKVEIVCTLGDQKTYGHAFRREFSKSERAQRTLKVGGILFGVTLLTAFIPVLHFVLVPLFLILSLVFGLNAWTEKAEIQSAEAPCPSCAEPTRLGTQAEGWPKTQRCPKCQFLLSYDVATAER